MFDAGTAALIRSAPAVEGVNPEILPQELTRIYAELVALRLRATDPDAAVERAPDLDRLLRVAAVYEAITDTARNAADRRAAAFVAATAYQIVGRIDTRRGFAGDDMLTANAIHPALAAPLLFIIAGQSPDAREAGLRLQGLAAEDLVLTALLESIADLSAERFEAILARAQRLRQLRSSAAAPLELQATQALYGLCWSGLVQIAALALDQAAPQSAFRRGDTAQATFRSVEALAIGDLAVPGDGGAMTSAFTGPRHLARLLRDVAEGLMGSSLAVLPVPAGAKAEVWRRWIRNRARSKPTIWPNHRPAIDDGLLDAGRSAVLVLPTGAGKTTVSELKIAATLAAGRKVIFLVPTLALVDQLRDDLARSFPDDLGSVAVSTDGDLSVLTSGPELGDIEVMTPERLLATLGFADADVSEVGLIILDECHILSPVGGGNRSLDSMLCLMHAAKRAPKADFLLLSAMLTNGEELAAWLTTLLPGDARYYHDPWKPSRQARGVIVYPKAPLDALSSYARSKRWGRKPRKPPLEVPAHALFGLQNNWNSDQAQDTALTRLLPDPVRVAVGRDGPTANANKVSAAIAARTAGAGLKTIIFVQQADYACSTAKGLAPKLPAVGNLSADELTYQQEIAVELGPKGRSLVNTKAGAIPHNGDMLAQERRLAESLFQRADGARVIVATPTLAQGMNLPAQVAILAGNIRNENKTRQALKQHELLNAAGRAGRAGHLANGLVLLVPEPVVGFTDAAASDEAFTALRSILPANDQCVRIDDPMDPILDQIQIGGTLSAEARYFMSRLKAGEPDDTAVDAAVEMVRRSLGGYQAKLRDQDFEAKLVALRTALMAEAEELSPGVARVAAFTGLNAPALQALSLILDAQTEAMPSTIQEWCDWIVDQFAAEPVLLEALMGQDADTVKAVCRGTKSGPAVTLAEFGRLKAGLRAWVTGEPFDRIEIALGVAAADVDACARSRDLVLKLANRRLYLIAAAVAELVKEKLTALAVEAVNPAVLEILPIAIRRGWDTPEKAAFAYRHPDIRGRVAAHRAYADRLGATPPTVGRTFAEILSLIDAKLAFGVLKD
jgi:ATP-dependent RNA helicase HelY